MRGRTFLVAVCLSAGFSWEALASTASSITCGTTAGEIATRFEQDAFTFEAVAGERVVFGIERGTGSSLTPRAELYAPGGAPLDSTGGGRGPTSPVLLPTSGSYTLLVHSRDYNNAGAYLLSLQFTTGRCGQAIECGDLMIGAVAYSTSWSAYTFAGSAGEAVVFGVERVAATNLCARADLYDPAGMLLESATSGECGGWSPSTILPMHGTYTILVRSRDHNNAGGFGLSMQFTARAAGRSCPARDLLCGSAYGGDIAHAAQQDAYSFCGTLGQVVTLTVAAAPPNTICALAELYDAAGTWLGDTTCNESPAVVALSADGEYTVLVHSGNEQIGSYGITLSCAGAGCATSAPETAPSRGLAFQLLPNSPNPFYPHTTMRYTVAVPGPLQLSIHDLSGRRIATLCDGQHAPGTYAASWDGRDVHGVRVASGAYVARLSGDAQVSTRRILLIR